MSSALDKQVGGSHYKKKIQPLEYAFHNNFDGFQTKILKYIDRWKDKGGIEDLEKAQHVLEMYIELNKKYRCED